MEETKNYKEELEWLENTPWYIGNDGMPNVAFILGVILTGVIPAIIGIDIYRHLRKKWLKKQIKIK